MSAARLPAHLEVAAMLRLAQDAGGFATVLQRGERDAGVILLLTTQRGRDTHLWERMPQLDGGRVWTVTRKEDTENKGEFSEYLARRTARDPDCWLIELDIDDTERFVALLAG